MGITGRMTRQGVTLKDVSAEAYFKELAPYDEDWYYIRLASVARKVYLRQKTGVGALRKVYGGADRRGARPSRFTTCSGGLIRKILQDLEEMGVVTKAEKGRMITDEGQRSLDSIAFKVVNKE